MCVGTVLAESTAIWKNIKPGGGCGGIKMVYTELQHYSKEDEDEVHTTSWGRHVHHLRICSTPFLFGMDPPPVPPVPPVPTTSTKDRGDRGDRGVTQKIKMELNRSATVHVHGTGGTGRTGGVTKIQKKTNLFCGRGTFNVTASANFLLPASYYRRVGHGRVAIQHQRTAGRAPPVVQIGGYCHKRNWSTCTTCCNG